MSKLYVAGAVLIGAVATAWITWWTPICIGLAAVGWNAMDAWDHMGDIWHRALIVLLLFVLFFLFGGLAATICRYREARKSASEQEVEETPRADTGALFAVKQPMSEMQEDLEEWSQDLASIAASNPEMVEARIGAFPLDWTMESANAAMHRFEMLKRLRGEA